MIQLPEPSAYAGCTAKELAAMHVDEHRKLFPASNPVHIQGCCCPVARAWRAKRVTGGQP